MEVRRLLLVPHPAERMYDLIEGAEHYPAFLPWCGAATVLERTDEEVAARVTVEVRGVRFQFVTRNRKRRPTWMGLGLEEGPFRRFDGEWNLAPLGDAGCRIDFVLRYDFENALMRRVAGAVFERITSTLVDAFVARADALGDRIPKPLPVGPAQLPAPATAPTAPEPEPEPPAPHTRFPDEPGVTT
jgi:ribosome-associated toxin RatA of RatAB toxin-antitoxin module